MLGWAVTCFVIAIVSGLLGLSWVAGPAAQIAWGLFAVGLALFLAFLALGRHAQAR